MTITLENVLQSLCSEVSLTLTNDFQKVYTVSTPFEAKLVHEVLVAYGLDVKVYHQPEKPSKLYITHPRFADGQADIVYASALAYAHALKKITATIDTLCKGNQETLSLMDYNITFLKNAGGAKQIVIQMSPASDHQEPLAEPQSQPAAGSSPQENLPAAAATTSGQAVRSAPVSSNQAKQPKKFAQKKASHYEELSSGPAVGRGNYPGKLSAEGEAKANSAQRRFALMMFGNMSLGSYPMLVMAIILGIIFSTFVMFRGFLCNDLAVAYKNRAWYCSYENEQTARPKPQPTNTPVAPR